MAEAKRPTLERGLSPRHVEMIALGGTIGTGLFLGAGSSIKMAGPAILIVYMVTGLFMFWMMRALGELLLTDTSQTTFVAFIEKYLGKRTGFVIGWTYWIGWITIAMAELTAAGIYMRYWFPSVPVWIWEVVFLAALYSVNIIAVGLFGEMEFWFAMIKIVAIVAMIVTGIVMVIGHFKTEAGVTEISNLWRFGFVANHGHNMLAAFQMVFFAFLGIEFVGMTAAEAKDPLKTIPNSINNIIYRILIFYVGALIAIMSIQPWMDYSANQSPFVQVFAGIGITAAAGLINFVVLTAAASSLNSSLFATGRMLFALSGAKGYFGKLNRRNVPMHATNVSVILIALAVLVNYIFPTNAFELITSVASAAFIVIYAMLMLAHLRYRHSQDFLKSEQLFKMPGAPVTDYLTIAFLSGIFVILLSRQETRLTTILAIIWFIVMIAVSFRVKKLR
ncbi:APC family amino acid-polyamine-organocationtransporter [Weissella oryzae SG25]|uniref:APC family amino acid-polyamine-organocationtransporter n=1 Tax=Weissella oryzae (strain DSM 25784 / JCM 18191 / LMG 30913 / SG25) TaxID=1329250 RepID=A0A069CS73_WEIOS|nr:amino acid permease [Weissella oryzae]GAK30103.1 APC family amino acid-polyamine-organocationtransporter [Weissella oryzae SG25]